MRQVPRRPVRLVQCVPGPEEVNWFKAMAKFCRVMSPEDSRAIVHAFGGVAARFLRACRIRHSVERQAVVGRRAGFPAPAVQPCAGDEIANMALPRARRSSGLSSAAGLKVEAPGQTMPISSSRTRCGARRK